MTHAKLSGILLILCFGLFEFACVPNRRILNSAAETPAPIWNAQTPSSSFESDIQAMRNADYNYIYAFRRKDGRPMDSDDRSFININTPPATNRRRLSDNDKAIITGSNFKFPPEILKILTQRFEFEDYSKPESEIIAANANSNR